MTISFPAGKRVLNVHTPACKQGNKRFAWQRYKSLAVILANTPDMFRSLVSKTLANTPDKFRSVLMDIYQLMKVVMKNLSSDRSDSVLRDTVEAVKRFGTQY